MAFHLYDTKQRRIVPLEPVTPGQVTIYHCGMTVQSAPHLGHIRKEVVFDVLRRWLVYSGYHVEIVSNVTDIDDKILNKAAEQGIPWYSLAYHYELVLHDSFKALGCHPPTYEPRATGHIPEMVELVQALLDRGHAYVAGDGSGDVYFDVRSWPEYGSLTGQQLDDMLPAEDAPPEGKRDPRDFALWKGAKPTDPPTASWPTPWGRGRPGWHLECSTMAGKYLGDAFDIHGGGMDLKFPHHENEQAQSQAAGRPFAKYWMHSGWLTMAGEKMSKSLGNTAAVTEVVKRFPARAVRLYLAAPHYRSAVELSDDALTEAAAQLARIDSFTSRAVDTVGPTEPGKVPLEFIAAMDDDLGTPAAFAALFNEVRKGNQALADGLANEVAAALASVNAMLKVFGLNADDPVWEQGAAAGPDLAPVVDGLAQAWLDERQAARGRKDFAAADAIRDLFTSLGIKIEDTPDGARWSL